MTFVLCERYDINMNENYNLLRERILHGNSMFPFMAYHIDADKNFQEKIGCHWHDEMEILVILEGYAEVFIDSRSYKISKGNVVIIQPDRLHSVLGEEGVKFEFFAIVFHSNLLNSFLGDTIQHKYFDSVLKGETILPEYLCGTEEWEQKVYSLLLDIGMAFERNNTAYELLIKAKLYEVWYLLYIHAQKGQKDMPENRDYKIKTTKVIIEYIKENYNSQITLKELASEFGISEGHLCRLFKNMTKLSVVEYINNYRISMSIELLLNTDKEISDIAVMTGFNNISYFNKVFKKYIHLTPSEYRKTAKICSDN